MDILPYKKPKHKASAFRTQLNFQLTSTQSHTRAELSLFIGSKAK